MNYEVYCDESCPEAFVQQKAHEYIGIGSIWIPSDYRLELKSVINTIKTKYNINNELKWNKLSPAYYECYKELIDYFFSTDQIRARVIILKSNEVDNVTFHNSDAELSFYKFYYQLLNKWILDFNEYSIFLDFKLNREKGRLKDLWKALQNSNLSSCLKNLQALPSDESLGIQLSDVLTGLVTAKFNKKTESKAKLDLICHIEQNIIKKEIAHTEKSEEKFNIFRINLQGGW